MKLNILSKYSPPCQKSGSYLATISTANEGHNWEWILLRNHLKCLTSTFSSSRSRNLRRHSPLHSLFFSCSDREWKQSEQTEKQIFSRVMQSLQRKNIHWDVFKGFLADRRGGTGVSDSIETNDEIWSTATQLNSHFEYGNQGTPRSV